MSAGVQKALVAQEIQALFEATGGEQLKPDAVWRWAKTHPDSALYEEFDWDVEEAAQKAMDPEAWLKAIRELRKENKQEQADREWQRFRAAFPDYEVAETDAAREAQN